MDKKIANLNLPSYGASPLDFNCLKLLPSLQVENLMVSVPGIKDKSTHGAFHFTSLIFFSFKPISRNRRRSLLFSNGSPLETPDR